MATKTLIIVANQVDIALSKAHLGIKKDINNKKELSMSVMDRKRRVYDYHWRGIKSSVDAVALITEVVSHYGHTLIRQMLVD